MPKKKAQDQSNAPSRTKARKLTQLDRIEDLQKGISERLGRIEKKLDELMKKLERDGGWTIPSPPSWTQTPSEPNIPAYPVDPCPNPSPWHWDYPRPWPYPHRIWGDGPTCGDKTTGPGTGYRLNDVPYGDYDHRRNPHCVPPPVSPFYPDGSSSSCQR